jgi:hypothetical protein
MTRRVATSNAILTADLIVKIPDIAHHKSQTINGHVSLLLLYHMNMTMNPSVSRITELINAVNPEIAAQAGGMNMRLTKPVAMRMIPQYFRKKSHVQFWHCRNK